MEASLVELVVCLLLFSMTRTLALDTLTPGQSIKDGETLVSAGGSFELGFFSPGSSKSRYLGIWYKKISTGTVVWVADRENSISDASGVLTISERGILAVLNSTRSTVWSSNASRNAHDPVAQLLDSGNFVVKDGNDSDPDSFLWQSFDYPSDNILPGMKIGVNFVSGFDRHTSSWKSTEDPAQGSYSMNIDPRGVPQFVFKKGPQILSRVGPWNGAYFSGRPFPKADPVYSYEFILNKNEVYYRFYTRNSYTFSRYFLNPSGLSQRSIWNERKNEWEVFSAQPADQCSNYAFCGAYATCSPNKSPPCACLEGFMRRSPSSTDLSSPDWSDGCARRTPLACDGRDSFRKQTGLKLPDTSKSWADISFNLKDCEKLCLKNCSCTAYTNLDIREGGHGCLLWFGDLIDIADITEGGQDLYIRLAKSELDKIRRKMKSKKKQNAVIIAISTTIATGMIVITVLLYKRKKNRSKEGEHKGKMELPLFTFATIASATDNFSSNNKLGQGGFGNVYKGILIEGKEIAVKRLSKDSGQGLDEFKNEVTLIVKLQHRNLVKLFGCCIEGDERMLIYEYLPNKSLDYFIFDKARNKLLDWYSRMHIIDGVARGLLYLHHDSRLRIIHRDLKASNILLDNRMNPKISDFGLARKFGGDQTEDKTRRVVGTYGYMSPEYAFHGCFSMKSDVFSFGVLILEIITGKRSRGYSDHDHNLLGHAWRMWTEEKPLELVDNSLEDSYIISEVLRCIHVALLCVQQRPEDRPNMSSVLLMLGGESTLPQPRQPGYFIENSMPSVDHRAGKQSSISNEFTVTSLEAR